MAWEMEAMLHIEDRRSRYDLTDGTLAAFQPGDATLYNFMWSEQPNGFLLVAGTPDLAMYEYELESILECYNNHADCVGRHRLPIGPYIGYVVNHSRNCNPWTAWAMVQCIAEYYMKL